MKKIFMALAIFCVVFLPGAAFAAARSAEATEALFELVDVAPDVTPAEVRKLIEAGADVNAKDYDGEPALCGMYASYAAMSLMIENGADTYSKNYTLWDAFGIVRGVSFLLDNGADVNSRNEDGDTLLMHAAANGSGDSYFMIKLLLEKGADVRSKNDGRTALDIFKENNSREDNADYDAIVKLLSGAAKTPPGGGRVGEMPLVPGLYALDKVGTSYDYYWTSATKKALFPEHTGTP